jgi:hypothetical protein
MKVVPQLVGRLEPLQGSADHSSPHTLLSPPHPEIASMRSPEHVPSVKADQYSSSLDFEQQGDKNADQWDTGSKSTSATEMDDTKNGHEHTKNQLEELQIRTIFSLVEPLEIEVNAKTMHKKLLFITNKRASLTSPTCPTSSKRWTSRRVRSWLLT